MNDSVCKSPFWRLTWALCVACLSSPFASIHAQDGPLGGASSFFPRSQVFSRSHASIRSVFRDTVKQAAKSTVEVWSERQRAALGTIVQADGYVLTKASEIKGNIECHFADGRRLPATLIGTSQEFDLALLKVDAVDLVPVIWSEQKQVPVGSWLVTAGQAETPQAIGVVSSAPRRIAMPQAVLGVRLSETAEGPEIAHVVLDSAASRARLQSGDLILKVGEQVTTTPESVSSTIQRYLPGDEVVLQIRRGGTTKPMKVVLGDINTLGNTAQAEIMDSLGGPLSKRRAGFPSVIQHDSVISPRDCGGPVVASDGKVVGINIARASRVASFAIPAAEIQSLLPRLMSEKFLVRSDKPPMP